MKAGSRQVGLLECDTMYAPGRDCNLQGSPLILGLSRVKAIH